MNRSVIAVGVVLILVAGACSGDDDAAPATSSDATIASTAPPTTESTTTTSTRLPPRRPAPPSRWTASSPTPTGSTPPVAIARGEAELAARGVTGTVTVNGQTVTVTTTITVDYEILPGSRTVTEAATADPSQGVTTGSP